MGLDIRIYKNLTAAPQLSFDEGNYTHVDRDGNKVEEAITITTDKWNRHAPYNDGDVFTYESSDWMRAGSYGYYNKWRDQLARMAGYPSAESLWGLPSHVKVTGAFIEHINFSDCEGLMGAEVCAKLAKDYADFQEQAEAFAASPNMSENNDGTWFIDKYNQWRAAFESAANGGLIVFC